MGLTYLLDTNAIIYFLKGRLTTDSNELIENVIHESLNISIITKIELLCWKNITDGEIGKVREFLNYAKIHYLDDQIADLAVSIRKEFNLKLPDAVIAATTAHYKFKLITADHHFEKIPHLSILSLQHL